MDKRNIAKRVVMVAEIRERKARIVASKKASEVAQQQRVLDSLSAAYRSHEGAASTEPMMGAWLGVVDQSRQAIRHTLDLAQQELAAREQRLHDVRQIHLEKWQAQRAAEKVVDRLNDVRRREIDRHEQREQDELSGHRYVATSQ